MFDMTVTTDNCLPSAEASHDEIRHGINHARSEFNGLGRRCEMLEFSARASGIVSSREFVDANVANWRGGDS